MVSALNSARAAQLLTLACVKESVLTALPSRDLRLLSWEVQAHRPPSELVLGCKGEMWGSPVPLGIIV